MATNPAAANWFESQPVARLAANMRAKACQNPGQTGRRGQFLFALGLPCDNSLPRHAGKFHWFETPFGPLGRECQKFGTCSCFVVPIG